MQQPQSETVTLNDILITEELSRRSPRPSNLLSENQALHTLARQLVNQPETMLQSLVDMALDLCSHGTAGVSLLETTPNGEEIFRWNVLSGTLAQYVGGTTPRHFSPCGVCLDRSAPVLFSHPERYFTYFQEANTTVVEGLVLPLIADNHALGTIWIMSHDERRHFDPEDVRVMASLADFTAAALLVNQRQTQELLAKNSQLEAQIVDRNRVQMALRESEERLRLATEAAQMYAWEFDLLTATPKFCANFERVTGHQPASSFEENLQFVHPDDRATVTEAFAIAIAGDGKFDYEMRSEGSQQQIDWYRVCGAIVRDANDRPTRAVGIAQNITEAKHRETQLRQAQRRLELSLTGANLGIWTYNVVTDEFWADDRAKQMHGHPPNEAHTFAEAGANIHPEDRDRARAAIARAILDRSKLQIEYRVIWRDGSVRWIASYAEFMPTGDRDLGMFYGVAQDISDRKKAEAAKSESEARLRALIEHLPGGAAFVLDRDLRYLLAEGEALSAAGFKPEDLVGRTIFEVLPPELAAYYEPLYRRGLAGESFEHEHTAHDRSYISRGTPLRSADGKVYAVLAVSYDMSDRKQAETALRESEAKYRTLFDSIDEAFCLLEILYDEQGAAVDLRYHDTNRVFERQTGIANAEGKRAHELILNLEPFWIETYDRVVRTGEPVRFENYVQGTDHWFNVYASRVGSAGSRFVAVVFNDITDRKRTEINLAFLAEVSQNLVHLTNIDETMNALGAKIGGHFNVADVIFAEISEDQQTVHVNHEWHRADFPEKKGSYAVKEYFSPEFERLHRAGEIAFVRDTAQDERVDADGYAALGIGAFVGVPLIRQDKWRFYLTLLDSKPHDWRNDEIELLRELTTRIWTCLERARAEEALRESEELLSSTLSGIEGAVMILEVIDDGNFRFIGVNRACVEWTGVAIEQWIGRPQDILPLEEATAICERYASAVRSGRTVNYEELLTFPTRKIWAFTVVTPLRDVAGKMTRVVSTSIDITERKQAEAALRELQERLSIAIEAAQMGIWEWDMVNDVATRTLRHDQIFGYDTLQAEWSKEIMQRHILEADREIFDAAIARARETGELEFDLRVCWSDGSVHWVADRGRFYFDDEGNAVRAAGVTFDITDRKQAEADRIQLIQEQANRLEAERISQMKDEFLAMVSHELQSPLVAILGWTRLLRANLPAPAMLMKHLETIERNATLQAKLIQDLLDISRITVGKLRLTLQPIALESAIETAIAAVSTAAIVKNISLHYPSTNRAIASVLVMGDRDRLQQVFCNLLTNAIKFTPEGGRVTVEVSIIKAEKPKSASIAEIRFVDTGIGICEDFLPHVFDRFRQAEKSGSAGGLGLGLAIARHLVELHDGTIHAASEGIGQGATFIVKLPLLK